MEIGCTGNAPSVREKEVMELFEGAEFKVSIKKDIAGWLLIHYIMNAAMEGAASKAGGFGEAISSSEALSLMILNLKKMIPYLNAKGIKKDGFLTVISILPHKLMGVIIKNLVYKPGSPMHMAQSHNHFKPGYAVEEIKADAKELGIFLDL